MDIRTCFCQTLIPRVRKKRHFIIPQKKCMIQPGEKLILLHNRVRPILAERTRVRKERQFKVPQQNNA